MSEKWLAISANELLNEIQILIFKETQRIFTAVIGANETNEIQFPRKCQNWTYIIRSVIIHNIHVENNFGKLSSVFMFASLTKIELNQWLYFRIPYAL